MSVFDVVTIGSATRDVFIRSGNFHVDRDSHVLSGKGLVMPLGAKIDLPELFFSTGGGATNAAVTFARHGLKTACIAAVGDDVSGRAVAETLKKDRISAAFLAVVDRPTAYSMLLEPPSGERTVLVYRGAASLLDGRRVPWSRIRTRMFYVSALGGNIGFLRRIIAFGRRKKITIAYNPGGGELRQRRALLPMLKHIQILIANREEAAAITGVPFGDVGRIFKKWDVMSPGINVMTDARNGVWVSDGTFLYKAGIFKEKKLVDRTGAGDAFGSGFVASLAAHPNDIERAIRFGSANATAKVEGIGAKYGLLTRAQFERDRRWRRLKITKTRL